MLFKCWLVARGGKVGDVEGVGVGEVTCVFPFAYLQIWGGYEMCQRIKVVEKPWESFGR